MDDIYIQISQNHKFYNKDQYYEVYVHTSLLLTIASSNQNV